MRQRLIALMVVLAVSTGLVVVAITTAGGRHTATPGALPKLPTKVAANFSFEVRALAASATLRVPASKFSLPK